MRYQIRQTITTHPAYPIKPLYEAIAHWYQRRHGVEIDPETEVLYCLDAAEGLFQLPNCLLDPSDTALISDPAYLSYEAAVKMAGGKVEYYPLLPENKFLPDLNAIPSDLAIKAKMILVRFPNNPTTAIAGEETNFLQFIPTVIVLSLNETQVPIAGKVYHRTYIAAYIGCCIISIFYSTLK